MPLYPGHGLEGQCHSVVEHNLTSNLSTIKTEF